MHEKAQMLAAEFAPHLLGERLVGIETRHLVFVLVSHQFEQVAGDRVGQTRLAGRARRLDRRCLLHPPAIARRIGGVLIGREKGDAARHHLVEGLREAPRIARRFRCRLDERLDRRRLAGGAATPMERGLVHLHGLAVELDRLRDRGGRERDRAELIGIADEKDVGADAVAEERRCGPRRVDEVRLLAAGVSRMARLRRSVGSEKSALRVKSPGSTSARLMTISVVPCFTAASTFLLPATTMSPPSTRSAPPAAMRMAWISSERSAMRIWLKTAPPFCARPAMSITPTPLPSRWAAMPRIPPMVTMPVPPTPVTVMS